ncbi:hypothetical protein HKCCSP123_07625 [Rhodobacterales bacterium HKCCSP123]|nr:hypothetical protein [Rhodobacterales bacterium HKCCSP123]
MAARKEPEKFWVGDWCFWISADHHGKAIVHLDEDGDGEPDQPSFDWEQIDGKDDLTDDQKGHIEREIHNAGYSKTTPTR